MILTQRFVFFTRFYNIFNIQQIQPLILKTQKVISFRHFVLMSFFFAKVKGNEFFLTMSQSVINLRFFFIQNLQVFLKFCTNCKMSVSNFQCLLFFIIYLFLLFLAFYIYYFQQLFLVLIYFLGVSGFVIVLFFNHCLETFSL